MTKRSQTRRNRPLDRDGDGRDGGSLPGNKTAPMAVGGDAPAAGTVQPSLLRPGSSVLRHKDGRTGTFVEPEDDGRLRVQSLKGQGFWTFDPADCDLVASDDQADAANPGDPNKPNDGPPNSDATPPAQPETETAASWERKDAEILEDLQLMDEGWSGTVETLTLQTVKEWTDDQAREAQAYAASIAGLTPERRAPAPEFLQPFLISKPPVEPATTGDGEATFTAEEIAAGKTPIVQEEGEASAEAADVATQISAEDPLVTIETDTAPIAVRLRELQVLIGARRLYKSADGYSANYGAPFIDESTVQGWIKAGLALDVPSAGNAGGVRLTAQARSVATRLRQELRSEAA